MDKSIIDDIMENLLHIPRIIHRKLLKIDPEVAEKGISPPHLAMMHMIGDLGPLPVSEIGKELLIPKPQMTHLVDQLITLGLVQRLPHARDRRIVNVALTDEGKTALAEWKSLMRSHISKKLSCLTDDELEELSDSLRRLRSIGARLE